MPHYPRDESDPKWLLKWLHSLRLHKYAPSLKDLTPGALLELAEDELIEKGIGSIGARKKLIVVRQDCIASDLGTYRTLILYSQAFEEARKQISEDEKKSV